MAERNRFPVFTVGHSNHEAADFVALLRGAGVELLVDVRLQPDSRFSPQFSKGALAPAIEEDLAQASARTVSSSRDWRDPTVMALST